MSPPHHFHGTDGGLSCIFLARSLLQDMPLVLICLARVLARVCATGREVLGALVWLLAAAFFWLV